MKQFILTILGILIAFVTTAQRADIILTHGKIFTADTSRLYVEALAIKGNRILAVGSNDAIEKLASYQTKRIDLQGKTVVPGFNNAHEHLGFSAPVGKFFRAREFSILGPASDGVLDSVKRLVKNATRDQWISGDIGLTVLQDLNIRQALDSIAPENPVCLQVMWGHGIVLNTKALQMVGISDTAADPLGGWYSRYPGSNRITGALYEYAQWPLWHQVPVADRNNLIEALRSFAEKELRAGITTVQNMACMIKPASLPKIFHDADLPLRVRIISMPGTSQNKRNLAEWKKVDAHLSRLTYTSGIKYLLDGSPLEQGAFMKKAYPGRTDWHGRLNMPADTIKKILQEALNSDIQLMVHAVGDSSLSIVLSLMKQMADGKVWRSKRVRIEHNSTPYITNSEIDDLRELGLLIMHTPKHNQSSPLRSFLKNGITVGISPDGTTNPFWDIMVVTGMQTKQTENMTREEAVIAYTITNAYAEFAEKEKGTLSAGMLADLAVLSQDIFTISSDQLAVTTSLLTIVDGKIVYQSKENK